MELRGLYGPDTVWKQGSTRYRREDTCRTPLQKDRNLGRLGGKKGEFDEELDIVDVNVVGDGCFTVRCRSVRDPHISGLMPDDYD
jgi:hypothetical protein